MLNPLAAEMLVQASEDERKDRMHLEQMRARSELQKIGKRGRMQDFARTAVAVVCVACIAAVPLVGGNSHLANAVMQVNACGGW